MAVATSTAILAATAVAAAAAGASYYQGEQQRKSQERAAGEAKQAAEKQTKQAEEQINRTQARRPDTSAMVSANEQAAKGGVGGTMLTGPGGVDPAALQIGKNTLLGG